MKEWMLIAQLKLWGTSVTGQAGRGANPGRKGKARQRSSDWEKRHNSGPDRGRHTSAIALARAGRGRGWPLATGQNKLQKDQCPLFFFFFVFPFHGKECRAKGAGRTRDMERQRQMGANGERLG